MTTDDEKAKYVATPSELREKPVLVESSGLAGTGEVPPAVRLVTPSLPVIQDGSPLRFAQLFPEGEEEKTLTITIRRSPFREFRLWLAERFAVKNKRDFWIALIVATLCLAFFAPRFIIAPIAIFLMICYVVLTGSNSTPAFLEWMMSCIGSEKDVYGPVAILMKVSVVQEFAVFFTLLLATFIPILYVRQPTALTLTAKGLRLRWTRLVNIEGPLIPWQSVSLVNTQTNKWLIGAGVEMLEIRYNDGNRKIKINLNDIPKLADREQLLQGIQTWTPPNTIDPSVPESLLKMGPSTYTELWLQSLRLPQKRERLAPLLPGTKLHNGAYLVEALLASGGQATTYSARYAADGQTKACVLKEFILPIGIDTEARTAAMDKFLTDANLLKQLKHPGVVDLHGCFVEDHRGYVVMECITGKSLKQIVSERGALPEAEVRRMMKQLLEILVFLHGRTPPVVHRDFTPDNLLLRDDGQLKLVDFNVATTLQDGVTGTMVGKPAYVPPEQVAGEFSQASDIYALGATLYFLLTGEDPQPISCSNPQDVAPTISDELAKLVSNCTALDPTARPPSARELLEILTPS